MILLCGIPSETPMALVHEQLRELGIACVVLNQREFAQTELEFSIHARKIEGSLCIGNRDYSLEDFSGVYTRLMDDRLIPEIQNEPPMSAARRRCRALHETLMSWLEIAPTRVVNRAQPMATNFSKPYQTQLIRQEGFLIPDTLITNSPEQVIDFLREHGNVVYKSISSARSIVQLLKEDELDRLHMIRWCPVQFQKFVEGNNVRVHVVGSTVFATAVTTNATDYRYAERQSNTTAQLRPVDLSDELAERCVSLSRALGLAFAGIDLKITPDDRVFCFEVNPSPAFSYYEGHTDQPIAREVARYLAGMSRPAGARTAGPTPKNYALVP